MQIIVQHHPSREALLQRVTEHLGDHLVVTDPGGEEGWNAWRSYRLCLRVETEASHILIVQDDAVPCEHFAEAAEAAIATKPDAAIAFYLGGQPVLTATAALRASIKHERWVRINPRDWVPTVATAYPLELARELADFGDARRVNGRPSRGDDSVAGDFFRINKHRIEAWATVPSLVEHPDDTLSLIGRRNMNGLNRGRVAKIMVQGDARAIRW